jgi:hypothetical protein
MFAKKVLGVLFVFMLSNSNTYASSSCSASDKTVTAVEGWLDSKHEFSSEIIRRLHIISALKKDDCIDSKLKYFASVNQTFDEDKYDSLIDNLAIRVSVDTSQDTFKDPLTVRQVIENFLYE